MILSFEAWPDADVDRHAVSPESVYARSVWLPIVGPSCWLVWGTVAAQLRRTGSPIDEPGCVSPEAVHWDLFALAAAHGIYSHDGGRSSPLRKSLDRLSRFRLLDGDTGGERFRVRLWAPPATDAQLDRLPPYASGLHRVTFGEPASVEAGGWHGEFDGDVVA